MKVLILNGSPHKSGTTSRALEEVARTLNAEGVETEIFWLGAKPVGGCMACFKCIETGSCVIRDAVNEFREKAYGADGFVFGSPTHYGGMSGNFAGWSTGVFEQLAKYFTVQEMPVISTRYWNNVFGMDAAEAEQDGEGLYNMRVLGRNMAYFLKCKDAAEKLGVEPPKFEPPVFTNFVRRENGSR